MHNLKLELAKSLPSKADVVIVGLALSSEDPTLVGGLSELDNTYQSKFGMSVLEMALAIGAQSDAESVTILPKVGSQRVVVVGLGEEDICPAVLRRVCGSVLRAVTALPEAEAGGLKVALSLELDDPELFQAAAEGAALGAYRIQKVTQHLTSEPVAEITLLGEAKEALEVARVTSKAVYQSRDWSNTPPNDLYPENFAEQAKAFVKDQKISVEILDERALEKGGYGGIMAVGGGSSRKPRLVRMSYSPRGAKFHLALVGKGITFDSGGLDIKTAEGMLGMQMDMSGAGIVIATIHAIARLGLKIQVTAYAAMAENMPSGTAYRPCDVLRMFDGQTVENYNTDAEGRLVMADAIARASTDHPDLIIDVATLTGACMVALGDRLSGVMSNDQEATESFLDASEAAGEEFWPLPITDRLRDQLKSDIADFRSGGKTRYGGASIAAAFLEKFVGEDISWIHLDVAGTAESSEAHGYTPKGGTGVAVRTLIAFAQQQAE